MQKGIYCKLQARVHTAHLTARNHQISSRGVSLGSRTTSCKLAHNNMPHNSSTTRNTGLKTHQRQTTLKTQSFRCYAKTPPLQFHARISSRRPEEYWPQGGRSTTVVGATSRATARNSKCSVCSGRTQCSSYRGLVRGVRFGIGSQCACSHYPRLRRGRGVCCLLEASNL